MFAPSSGSGNSLKLCLVGAEQSGKTALVNRILFSEFEEQYFATLEDSYRNSFVEGYHEHLVDILDIGGLDQYQAEYDRWFSWADAFLYVYSTADEESFYKLRIFRDEIAKSKKKLGVGLAQIPCLLIGTHLDEERKIPEINGKKMADALGCPFFETTNRSENISEWSKWSSVAIPPAEIINHLIKEAVKKNSWRMLDSLTIPPPLLLHPSKKIMKEKLKLDPHPGLSTIAREISLLEELREKWERPISKLPVYIDFPRLVTKISIIVHSSTNRRRNSLPTNSNLLTSVPGIIKGSVSSESIGASMPSPPRSGSASASLPKVDKKGKKTHVRKKSSPEQDFKDLEMEPSTPPPRRADTPEMRRRNTAQSLKAKSPPPK